MKKWILIVALLPLVASAQTAPQDNIARHIQIKDVNVYAKRPIKEIGTQQTKFDTVVLKENIALSMADVLTFNSSIRQELWSCHPLYGRQALAIAYASWNGMKINNPMLGMTDFSMIPSYFVDDARCCMAPRERDRWWTGRSCETEYQTRQQMDLDCNTYKVQVRSRLLMSFCDHPW